MGGEGVGVTGPAPLLLEGFSLSPATPLTPSVYLLIPIAGLWTFRGLGTAASGCQGWPVL